MHFQLSLNWVAWRRTHHRRSHPLKHPHCWLIESHWNKEQCACLHSSLECWSEKCPFLRQPKCCHQYPCILTTRLSNQTELNSLRGLYSSHCARLLSPLSGLGNWTISDLRECLPGKPEIWLTGLLHSTSEESHSFKSTLGLQQYHFPSFWLPLHWRSQTSNFEELHSDCQASTSRGQTSHLSPPSSWRWLTADLKLHLPRNLK